MSSAITRVPGDTDPGILSLFQDHYRDEAIPWHEAAKLLSSTKVHLSLRAIWFCIYGPQNPVSGRELTYADIALFVDQQYKAVSATHRSFDVRMMQRGSARRPRLSPLSLTAVAVLLAGRKRSSLGDEWRGHLRGESGVGLAEDDQLRAARGFLWAAVRYRCNDVVDLAWLPVEAVLKSRILSNLFVFGVTAVVSLAVRRADGTIGLVKSAEAICAIGGALYGLVRVGRWWRNVKPPEPKARKDKNE